MCEFDSSSEQRLDDVINARRTYRGFRPESPPREEIMKIIRAGLAAPFAAAAVGKGGKEYFRQFYVFPAESRSLAIAGGLLMQKVHAMAEDLGREMERNPALKSRAATFAARLEHIRNAGFVPGVETAPYFIVVAERRGFPEIEQQSLAYCLENMWLKATVLNLGFQLVSATSGMGDDPEFCRLLGIPPGAYALNGCAIGYYQEPLPPSVRPPGEDVTTWME